MVMATGIISLAAGLYHQTLIGDGLFGLNIVLYAGLCGLTTIRLVAFPDAVWSDAGDHARGVGFFTIIAGSGILGSEFLVTAHSPTGGLLLGGLAVVLWPLVTYGLFTRLTIKGRKPPFTNALNGAWLLAAVAAQSLTVLGGRLAGSYPSYAHVLLFFALMMWLVGGMFYVGIIALIFFRYLFLALDPADWAPSYWINMGAAAISALAGTVLIEAHPAYPLLKFLLPFMAGLTLLFWVAATWWLPLLIILSVWRHLYGRRPLAYDPLYWSAVFPLGMYAVCTYELAEALSLPFLRVISAGVFYLALGAWVIMFLGLVRHVGQSLGSQGLKS